MHKNEWYIVLTVLYTVAALYPNANCPLPLHN